MPTLDDLEQRIAAVNGSSEPVWTWQRDGAPYIETEPYRTQFVGWLREHGIDDPWRVRDLAIAVSARTQQVAIRVAVSERDELGRPTGRVLRHEIPLVSAPPMPPTYDDEEQQP